MNAPKGEQTIFEEALRLPREERAAYLAQVTSGDPELRRELESLLQSYADGKFLEQSAGSQLRSSLPITRPLTEKPGDTIGRYKLLEQIGEGGCGVVYMAEQSEPVRRRVALKIIKLGMDTKLVTARFEAERQALALMNHPNIAKVFDAGATEAGRPYFVMELVRGTKITEYCDEKRLSTGERLDLFVQVCHAIQHAHQKGIIHRDIKPSNILVSMDDGVAVSKVIDFGVAKATGGQRLTEKTLFTAFEQLIGTPAYMSPEQTLVTNVDIDTRSDIYALGVLLYELLTGQTPFDPKELLAIGLDEMRHTIREKEPPKPSTCVSTLPGQNLSTAAQRRGLEAPKLVSELQGDLDWIVMKCLEKDRTRRYETANGLAMDIQRHLNNEPVVACPPGNLYRLRKLVRRNKLVFAAGTAVAAALLLGMTTTTWMFVHEREAKRRAVAAEAAERKLRQEAELRELDTRSLQLASGMTRDLNAALEVRKQAIEAQKRVLGPDHPDVAESLERLALLYGSLNRLADAEATQQEVVALHRKRSPQGDAELASALKFLASILDKEGKTKEAEATAQEAVKMLVAISGYDSASAATTLQDLAAFLAEHGHEDQALDLFQRAFDRLKKSVSPDDLRLALVARNLIFTYVKRNDIAKATALARDLGPEQLVAYPDLLNQISRLLDSLFTAGKFAECEKLLDELLSKAPNNSNLLHERAWFAVRRRQFDAAVADYQRLIELQAEDDQVWLRFTALLAATDARSEFDQRCEEFMERFKKSATWQPMERAAKSALLLPGSSENTQRAIQMAEELDTQGIQSAWMASLKGLTEYRRGAFEKALDYLQQATKPDVAEPCRVNALVVAAMAHYQLHQLDEARSALAEATTMESAGWKEVEGGDRRFWVDWLRASVLLREANKLIGPPANSATALK